MSIKKTTTLFFLFLLAGIIPLFAQISDGGLPYSFEKQRFNADFIDTRKIPSIDIKALKAEDAIDDKVKDIPWRFGFPIPVNFDLNNSGTWDILDNGDRLWRLTIYARGAKTLNFNYDRFFIPPGAKFFVYNENKSQFLGAFTNANMNTDGTFATSLVKGEKITLEYYEPAGKVNEGKIQISTVVFGYRDLFNRLDKEFGEAGGCNENVNCPSGADWQNDKRSVVMLLAANNSRFCSGALINNTKEDGIPYILTADHCTPATNSIFMFNYESSSCSPSVDGNTGNTLQGCTVKANGSASDFILLELNQPPPLSYGVYYAGWNSENIPAAASTGIHHPSGDVKKISFDYNPVQNSGYFGAGNDHWKVVDWDTGVTEGGSSGSPLFDQNHRIIGQLHGGQSACGNNLEDYYGKFSYSWQTDPTPSNQLKHWLAPFGTSDLAINGYDPQPVYLLDAGIYKITEPSKYELCSADSINPVVSIRNFGSDTLKSVIIKYGINSDTLSYTWTGSLSAGQIASISLPVISTPPNSYTFYAYTRNPNNGDDEKSNNNFKQFPFITYGNFYSLNLKTDLYGEETYWKVVNTSGTILYSGGNSTVPPGGKQTALDSDPGALKGNTTYNYDFCIAENCFTYIIYDDYDDGICCLSGTGSYLLKNGTGDTIGFGGSFGRSDTVDRGGAVALAALNDDTVFVDSVFTMLNNSSGADSYSWNFGDNSPADTLSTPSHSYDSTGIFSIVLTASDSLCSSTDTLKITVLKSVGIAEMMAENIKIYPNPTNTILNIETNIPNFKKLDIHLYSITGEILLHQTFTHSSSLFSFDLGNISQGLYFIEILTEQFIIIRKISVM